MIEAMRRRVKILALVVLVVMAAAFAVTELVSGLHPFGRSISDFEGCRQAVVASADFPVNAGSRFATDKSILPLGVVCQASTEVNGAIVTGPVLYFSSWLETVGFVFAALAAVAGSALMRRLFLAATASARAQ